MNKLPIFVLQLVQNYGNTRNQIALQSTNKRARKLGITIINMYVWGLSDKIILKYASTLQYLEASWNPDITDTSIKELKLLHTLYAGSNPKITDISVKELKLLHTLSASSNPNITDESI